MPALVANALVADVGRVPVGRLRFSTSSRMRLACVSVRSRSGVTPVCEVLGELALQQQRRDDRGEVGVAAALADAVERALDLAHAGAHRHQRVGDRVLGVVVGVDAEVRAGHDLRHLARRCARPRAAACRRWCRTARPSARRPRRRCAPRRARSRGCPCSRRRSARSRSSPRGRVSTTALHRLLAAPARFSSFEMPSATRT